jgi:succinyl-CoA synthetase alpha subunit
MDHIMRYQDDPDVKMIVLLGEVGGTEEYKIIEGIKSEQLNKPLVAWCIGTCAKMFTSEVRIVVHFLELELGGNSVAELVAYFVADLQGQGFDSCPTSEVCFIIYFASFPSDFA